MRFITACLALSLLAPAASADLAVKGELKVEPYRLVRLTAEGASPDAAIVWDLDEERLDAEESGNRLVFAGPPGTYRVKVRAITLTKEGKTKVETARATVVIGDGRPPAPPTPTPDPPAPPGPADPLAKRLLDAYAQDASGDKAKHVQLYAAVCRHLAAADLTALQTAGDLRQAMTKARRAAGVPDDALVPLRKVVEAEMREFLPTAADAAITQDHRAATAGLMARVAKALAGAK